MTSLRLNRLAFLENGPYQLSLKSPHCCCISGPSGIGKSKLFRCLADLDPYSGDVLLNDISSQEFKPTDWRKRVGFLPAESRWWHDEVGEHFHTCEVSILNQLGFDKEIMKWPVQRLSTGEKQRLAIVRLLINKPDVLLLDEPTAALDSGNVLRVEELILNIKENQDRLVLWVSHDPEQIQRIADTHLHLEKTQLTPMD